MNLREYCARIDVANLNFSVAILTPQKPFLLWLDYFKRKSDLTNYQIHCNFEDTVWIIPRIDSFTEPGSREEFIQQMKPRMLLSELYRYGATEIDFNEPICSEVFDAYFLLELRLDAALITELVDTKV